jgi:hypothetical protein
VELTSIDTDNTISLALKRTRGAYFVNPW